MKKIIILILLQTSIHLQAQDSLKANPFGSHSYFTKKNISTLSVTVMPTITILDSYFTWWKNDWKPFTFTKPLPGEGWLSDPLQKGIDKIGHLYTSYFLYHAQKNLLRWGEYDESKSQITSALITLGLAVMVEIGDGFSNYGFDYQDLMFNLGGLAFGILQDKYELLRDFQFKWSYFPLKGRHFPPKVTDDYAGHIYWFTIDVHNLIANEKNDSFLSYFQPAIGYSLNDDLDREFILGLDYNLTKIIKTDNTTWKTILKIIDLVHLPAPGIKFSKHHKPEFRLLIFN